MEDASESVDSYVFKSSGRGFGWTGIPVIPVVFLTTCWNRGRVKRNILRDVVVQDRVARIWKFQVQSRSAILLSTAMASIALHQTRTLFPALRSAWATPAITAALLPTFLASQQPFNWAMPTLQSLLDLLPPFLLAVPKKKVSHSRKAMRSANKGLKDKKSTRTVFWINPDSEMFSYRYCQLSSLRSTKTSASSMCRLLLFSLSEMESVCTVCTVYEAS
jgi:hypothetical protein